MCGIIGIVGENAVEKVKKGLALMKNRGSDMFGIATPTKLEFTKRVEDLSVKSGNLALGHCLHAIVNHTPQPLKAKGVLIANCEIYNWIELSKTNNISCKNDAELLLGLLDINNLNCLDLLDGVYAFAYLRSNSIQLARDILGIKPIWYSYTTDSFAFASEKKVLEKLGFSDITELNPRRILNYNITTNELKITNRNFFTVEPETKKPEQLIRQDVFNLLNNSIKKRIPNKKFGLLFSGGIDSTFLAKYFKDNNLDFTCYTVGVEGETKAKDVLYAEKIAKEFGLKLRKRIIKRDELPKYLKKVVPLIEDSNVVKVGVALTFYLACEMAKEDGCKVIFSGLGSEEIFAGYERHLKASNINKECVSGLLKMYERDLYRDDVITMANNLELRLPFLDKTLVEYALHIPEKFKIKDTQVKYIFRKVARDSGIPEEYAFRKKTAAQYGSRIDHAIGKLAKKEKKTKSEYLRQFYPAHNLKLGVLFSGGKDSTYAAYIMKKQNYQLSCLITLQSKNPDSFMFHTPAIELTKLQAESMDLPILIQETKGEKELELSDLNLAIIKAKKEYSIDGIVTGAVFSSYQRDRIEKICDNLGLKIFAPLWHKPQENLMRELLDNNFTFIFTGIAAEGLDSSWLGRIITLKDLNKLNKLNEKIGLNVAGEGGEFESLVLDCPLFKKKIKIIKNKISSDTPQSARLTMIEAKLVDKD